MQKHDGPSFRINVRCLPRATSWVRVHRMQRLGGPNVPLPWSVCHSEGTDGRSARIVTSVDARARKAGGLALGHGTSSSIRPFR